MTADAVDKMVKHYAKRVGVNIERFGAHSLRATAATNALASDQPVERLAKRPAKSHSIMLFGTHRQAESNPRR